MGSEDAPWFVQVGKAFSQAYYTNFDAGAQQRSSCVAPMFCSDGMLTYEDKQTQSPENIAKVLAELAFQKIAHVVTNIDCQPTPEMGVLIMVTGQLKTDEDAAHSFVQTFVLKPTDQNFPPASYQIQNSLFRLSSIHNIAP